MRLSSQDDRMVAQPHVLPEPWLTGSQLLLFHLLSEDSMLVAEGLAVRWDLSFL